MTTHVSPRFSTRRFVPAGVESRSVAGSGTSATTLIHRIVNNGEARVVDAPVVLTGNLGGMWRIALHSAATFAVILGAGLVCLATVPNLLGYRSVVVTSGSMEPSIRTADIVVTSATDGQELSVGTVINHDAFDKTTLHRIVGITDDGYRTAGDANTVDDSTLVPTDSVKGIGTVVVPFVGYPALWVENQQWLKLGALALATLAVGHLARPGWLQKANQW